MRAWRRRIAAAGNKLLHPFGAQVLRTEEVERLKRIEAQFFPVRGPSFQQGLLPPGAEAYLRPDNPRLLEIQQRYADLSCPATRHSVWGSDVVKSIDLRYFRGDNSYVFQFQQGNSEIAHLLTAWYTKSIDCLGLWSRLEEDGAFGVYTFPFGDGVMLSRDLLDSMNEAMFLEETIGISKWPRLNILDIGAGYGRLAYRMAACMPSLSNYICVDAIPESTFLCEYHLKYRGVTPMARAVLLDEIAENLTQTPVQLAINIHSFSECTTEAIDWWLRLLRNRQVQYLMIVPNHGTAFLSYERNGDRLDFLPLIESHGYRLLSSRPKYQNASVQRYGVSPGHYHLFELRES